MSLDRLAKSMVAGLVSFIFIFLSFFAYIIVKSDILDMKSGRLDNLLLFKDFIFIVLWLLLIPLIIFLFKRIKKE